MGVREGFISSRCLLTWTCGPDCHVSVTVPHRIELRRERGTWSADANRTLNLGFLLSFISNDSLIIISGLAVGDMHADAKAPRMFHVYARGSFISYLLSAYYCLIRFLIVWRDRTRRFVRDNKLYNRISYEYAPSYATTRLVAPNKEVMKTRLKRPHENGEKNSTYAVTKEAHCPS